MTEQQRPYSIRIFVPDGDPDGLRIVEKSNWTGVGVVFNRTNYKQAANRPEFERTGVYVLVGTSEESALPTIYVGEGDPIRARLNQHYRNREFWDWAVFFVAKDSSLNKAHVKRLEARLLALAMDAKLCKLDNTGSSLPPTLTDAETADVESFLLDMLSIFPLLGLGVFEKTQANKKPSQLLYIKSKNAEATGYEDAKGFVICEGSQLVKEESDTLRSNLSTLRKDLIEQAVIVEDGQHYVFKQDRAFGSPSKAASVVLGRAADGSNWKTSDGTTLKQMQAITSENGNDEAEDV